MSANDDAWIETFDAVYASIKPHVEEPTKGEIRLARERLRVEAITGDPKKAAADAAGIIQWMRGLADPKEHIETTPEQTSKQRT